MLYVSLPVVINPILLRSWPIVLILWSCGRVHGAHSECAKHGMIRARFNADDKVTPLLIISIMNIFQCSIAMAASTLMENNIFVHARRTMTNGYRNELYFGARITKIIDDESHACHRYTSTPFHVHGLDSVATSI